MFLEAVHSHISHLRVVGHRRTAEMEQDRDERNADSLVKAAELEDSHAKAAERLQAACERRVEVRVHLNYLHAGGIACRLSTMRFGSTAKVLAERMPKCHRIS